MYKGEKERNKYHVERSGNTVIYYSYKNYSNVTSTKLQIRISFFLFPFHVTEPMISSNILYLLLTIHKKFLLLSSWTLVYFTHHLFYNEYIYIFFFPFFLFQNFPAVSINRWKNDILLRWTPARGQCIATVWTLYTHHVEVSRSKMIASCPVWGLWLI